MFQPFRSWLLLGLLSLPLLTATVSCTKKEDTPTPAATTGGIEGTISPAGAITTVTATNANGITFLATPNASTGAFAFAGLAPGRYTLTFSPASGYGVPAARAIDVVAGQTAPAGTVVVVGDGTPRGTVAWTVDGTTFTSTALSGAVRAAGSPTELAAFVVSGGVRHEVNFYFPNAIPGLGTYTLDGYGPGANSAGYARTTGSQTVSYGTYLYFINRSTAVAGTGTLTVTAYNATARTLSGTFAFTAINTDGGPTNVLMTTISNGTFSFSY